jgi:hypothetical protein
LKENASFQRPPSQVSHPIRLITAVLRGENPAWPWAPQDEAARNALCSQAQANGVQCLLHAGLSAAHWPESVVQFLREATIQHTMWELRHERLVAELLQVLHQLGIEPVLFKGTALAYSLYAKPALRSRGDTDLIIASTDRNRVHTTLIRLGYEKCLGVSGDFVSYQATYTKLADGAMHALDLHWKINNSELLSRLFGYFELRQVAQHLPKLGAHALGLPVAYSLALACMHRATHKVNPYYVGGQTHYGADRLIWLYDIHLLACAMELRDWETFLQVASEKGLRAVSLDGVNSAQRCFGTNLPTWVTEELARLGAIEAPARYLNGTPLHQKLIDFRALGSLENRFCFLRESLFPGATYMKTKYYGSRADWLPWLYVRRGLSGLLKCLPIEPIRKSSVAIATVLAGWGTRLIQVFRTAP